MDRYPLAVLPPRDIEWWANGVKIDGGQSVSGLMQTSKTDGGGFWLCRYSTVYVKDAATLAAHTALEARLDGGVSPLIVPRPVTPPSLWLTPHSDGRPFSDGGLYEAAGTIVTLTDAAALRATTIDVEVTRGALGAFFTIDHPVMGPRYYAIATRTDLGAGRYRLTIRTPLREAVTAGEALDFDDPRCVMRLADPESIKLKLEYNKWGPFSPLFVEHFD